jgi:predicted transcriptional regulator
LVKDGCQKGFTGGEKKMWGLGRPRSKLGKFLDRHGYTIQDLSAASKVNRNTVGKMCSDPEYSPTTSTIKKIMKAIREIDPNAKAHDFFDM